MCLYVQLNAPVLTDSNVGAANQSSVRWCDYPGERLVQQCKFDVNGNPLDQYNSDATALHRKFMVQPNKKLAWDRCMGQQSPLKGYMSPDVSGAPDNHRVEVSVTNGPQTPVAGGSIQGLNLFIPLLFWCNKIFVAKSA
jgi:hypothetical protein